MYTAKKPCRFSGKQFFVGEIIPDEYVDSTRAQAFVNMGLIDILPVIPPNTLNKTLEPDGQGKTSTENEGHQSAAETQKNGQDEKPVGRRGTGASGTGKKGQK